MELTERWLNDSAGWQAVKEGKKLRESGAVLEAGFSGKLLKGGRADRAETHGGGIADR